MSIWAGELLVKCIYVIPAGEGEKSGSTVSLCPVSVCGTSGPRLHLMIAGACQCQ